MDRKKLVWGALLLFLMFLLVGSALASTGDGGDRCGSSGPVFGENGLIVKKDVSCSFERLWEWVIRKVADETSLILSPGQVFNVGYTVELTASPMDTNFAVSGTISILNTTNDPITIGDVSDSLGPVACIVNDAPVSTPFNLPGGWIAFCSYAATLGGPVSENAATVTDGDGYAVSAVAAIDWSGAAVNVVDQCVDVTDSPYGNLGTVCAGQQTSFTFDYTGTIGPYDVCGSYTVPNTATFTTGDSGTTGSSGWTIDVSVPCAGGCSLTPGYWKTHSAYGPAPYDDTWAMLGEDTPFFSSGQTFYQVLWSSPSGGDAYYILAHAYIAAVLNNLNGADTSSVSWQMAHAAALFSTYTPSSRLSRTVRADFINTASILDQYNNGLIGPGHCSE